MPIDKLIPVGDQVNYIQKNLKQETPLIINKLEGSKDNNNRLFYKGKDGREYDSSEDLAEADAEWMRQNFKFKGKDDREYATSEALAEANAEWDRQNQKQ